MTLTKLVKQEVVPFKVGGKIVKQKMMMWHPKPHESEQTTKSNKRV
jgi:hypothetical protein